MPPGMSGSAKYQVSNMNRFLPVAALMLVASISGCGKMQSDGSSPTIADITTTAGLFSSAAVVTAGGDQPVPGAASDHAAPQAPIIRQ
jgi:hypothetical protein